jgi:TBC1 domain family member 2
MAARPPPTRPHIGIHSSQFSSTDWGEDDAWDSTSDSESPRQSALSNAWNRSITRAPSSTTAPTPVPKSSNSPSSSTLAFSYTHINAPSPNSYSPKGDVGQTPKNGWTIVRRSRENLRNIEGKGEQDFRDNTAHVDIDVEGDMVVGELDPEVIDNPVSQKARQDQGLIRDDVDDILHGTFSVPQMYSPSPHATCRSFARCSPQITQAVGAITPTDSFTYGRR